MTQPSLLTVAEYLEIGELESGYSEIVDLIVVQCEARRRQDRTVA